MVNDLISQLIELLNFGLDVAKQKQGVYFFKFHSKFLANQDLNLEIYFTAQLHRLFSSQLNLLFLSFSDGEPDFQNLFVSTVFIFLFTFILVQILFDFTLVQILEVCPLVHQIWFFLFFYIVQMLDLA